VQGNAPPSVAIEVNLEKVPNELKPGFTVSLKILTASKEGVLAIPQEALFQESGKNYVFRVVNLKLEKMEISLGIVNETLQEITSGIQAGDQVVLNPTSQLAHGMLVRVDTGSGVS
jgi:HlyD family secretion protein